VSGKNRGKKRFEQIVENSRNLHRVKVLEKKRPMFQKEK
jgi:hypothetical protein